MRAVATASARGAPGSARLGRARGSPPLWAVRRPRANRRAARATLVFRANLDDRVGSESRANRGAARPSTPRAPTPAETWADEPERPPPSAYDLSEEDARAPPSSWPRDDRADARRADDTADARPRGFDRRDSPPPPPRPEPSLADQLPGGVGAVVAWILRAVSTTSDATARALAGLFPRSVPLATLRTLAYILWACLLFAVFQRLLSAFVLIGGLALLAIAVANGESMGAGRGGGFDDRRGRRPGDAWGTRSRSFDASRDDARRRRRNQTPWGRTMTRPEPEGAWTYAAEETSQDAGTTGTGTGGEFGRDEFYGGDEFARGDSEGFDDGRFTSWDTNRRGDFEFSAPFGAEWRAAATAAAATAAETMRAAAAAANATNANANARNPAADVASFGADAIDRVVASFEGAAGAADAGFSFDAFAAKDDTRPDREKKRDERKYDDAEDSDDDDDDDVVDVEARSVPFDEWVGRPSRDDVTEATSDESVSDSRRRAGGDDRSDRSDRSGVWTAATYRTQGGASSSSSGWRRDATEPNDDDRFDGFDGFDREGGYDRWTEASRAAFEEAKNFAGFGGGGGARGSRARDAGPNRWREFVTGRFYGTYQEDLVSASWAREGEDEGDEGRRGGDGEFAPSAVAKEAEIRDGRFVDGAWIVDDDDDDARGARDDDDDGGVDARAVR